MIQNDRLDISSDRYLRLGNNTVKAADFRTRVLISMKSAVGTLLRSGTAALVVPAFEYVDVNDGKDVDTFPRNKDVSYK